eukprot:scaffold37541_cov39-Phaeocystis_antarctica.AAC.2
MPRHAREIVPLNTTPIPARTLHVLLVTPLARTSTGERRGGARAQGDRRAREGRGHAKGDGGGGGGGGGHRDHRGGSAAGGGGCAEDAAWQGVGGGQGGHGP